MHLRPLSLAAVVLLAPVLVPGCGTEPEETPLSGTWTGTATFGSDVIAFTWEIIESGGVIAGTGTLTQDPLAFTGDVTGSYSHPDVRMTLTIVVDGVDWRFRWVGTRAGNDMLTGILHDPNDDRIPMPLRRAGN